MDATGRRYRALGGLLGLASVAAGAFGAHGLEGTLSSRMLEVFETAARYAMYHALALLALGAMVGGRPPAAADRVAAWGFGLGTLLFSGSLATLALGGPRWLGMVAPVGGVALMVGWAGVAGGAWARRDGADRL